MIIEQCKISEKQDTALYTSLTMICCNLKKIVYDCPPFQL